MTPLAKPPAEHTARYSVAPDGERYGVAMTADGERTMIEFDIKTFERALKRVEVWRAKEAKGAAREALATASRSTAEGN